MTRKDYQVIATSIHRAFTAVEKVYTDAPERAAVVNGVSTAADELADAFAVDNPRFKRDVFLRWCREGR